MCAIEIIKSVLGSTTLVVNRCDNTSALRQATLHPEAVKSRWKQVDLISRLPDVYKSTDSDMSMVHVYGYYNNRIPASTLTPLPSLNVRLDAIEENTMAVFIISSATIHTMVIGLSDPQGMPSLSIHGSTVHSNITQYIVYEISKRGLLQHWYYPNLTRTEDWDKIDITLFKQTRETTTVHMAHFITKFLSNTLPTMTILQQQGHASTNLCPSCGVIL